MKSKLLLRLLLLFLVPSLACTLLGPNSTLPVTTTPPPPDTSTATPGPVTSDNTLTTLNLSKSDQEGLLQRLNQIYDAQINSGGNVNRGVLIAAYAKLAALKHVGGQWSSAGPAPIQGVYLPQGQVPGSGRVNGFAIDPRNPKVVYAAISVGGIWKTEDGGQTWTSLTDQQVPLDYSGIVMDPKDPNTLYALLGEMDGGNGVIGYYGFLANGIMRTHDAGKTWQLIGQDTFLGASVTSLVFDQNGSMYASSGQTQAYFGPDNMPDFGVFRSDNGGDTWQRLAACADLGSCSPYFNVPHASRSGGFFDLKMASNGSLYASLCVTECESTSILRSTDGGKTWSQLDLSSTLDTWLKANKGTGAYFQRDTKFPGLSGLRIAVSATDPNILLAGGGIVYFDSKKQLLNSSWVIRSSDGGDTWEWLSKAPRYCGSPVVGKNGQTIDQCGYDNVIQIDPTDPKIMYLAGSFVKEATVRNGQPDYNWVSAVNRSADGGDTWADLTPATTGSFMHPDVHGLAIDPTNPNVIWVGNDGGVYRTSDVTANSPQWQSLSQGLSTLMLIDVALHPTDPNYLLAGMQDNARATTGDRQTWQGTASGDGAYVAVDPFKPNIVYGTIYPPGLFERNSAGGVGDWSTWAQSDGSSYISGLDLKDNWAFRPPFAVDPNNGGVLYLVSNKVYRTTDRGDNWTAVSDSLVTTDTGTIQSIVVAPSDSNVIYAGTSEGHAWASTDGSQTWNEITGSNFPPRNLNRLAVDPKDPKTVYAVFGGFNVETPDTPGHVFVTHDGGGSWTDMSLDLPDAPLSSVVVDGRAKYAGVYIGGTLGVWVLQAGSNNWLPYGTGMPFSLVSSLKLNPATGVMAAATFGRSVWVIDMP